MLSERDLHDFQDDAIRWMSARTFGKLWLGLGLGKTVVALTSIREMWRRYGFSRALIVAPKRVGLLTWPDEIAKWEHLADLDVAVAIGTAKQRNAAFEARAPITVTNYDNLVWMYRQGYEPPEIVIFDELARMKNHAAKRVKAHVHFKHRYKRLFGMTATPAAEKYNDLWAQEETLTLKRNILGFNITQFRNTYCDTDVLPNGGRIYTVREREREAIERNIAPTTLVMKSEDYISIKESTTHIHYISWPPAARALYLELEEEFVAEFERNPIEALNVGVMLNKLRQMCGGWIYDNDKKVVDVHKEKLQTAVEMVHELNGEPTLMLYQYKPEREALERELKKAGFKVESFRSGLSTAVERAILKRWNERDIDVLLGHPDSMGEGLNLQAAHTAIWYSMPWSLIQYLQAQGRIERQGQDNACVFHILQMSRSIDQLVWDKLRGKLKGQKAMIDAVGSYARSR